jgi:hypothetical protein
MDADQAPTTSRKQLSREQIGPFFLLGLDKDADASQIEAHWAQRVIWARNNEIPTQLGNVNWAREVLNDPGRRVSADVASFNSDTGAGELARMAEKYGLKDAGKPAWHVWDREKPLANYIPPTPVPDTGAVRAGITLPEFPPDYPIVAALLRGLAQESLDPWRINLSSGSEGVDA